MGEVSNTGTDLASAGSAALAIPSSNPMAMVQQGQQALTSFSPQQPQYQPQPQFQPPQINHPTPSGSYRTMGEHKRADKQALFSTIGNFVKSFGQYEQQKKERHVQMLSERLFGAYSGLEEAKQSGDKEAIQKNAQIINDILSDKKNRKLFEKAFDINFFGEDKHKDTPERKGVMKGLSASVQAMQKMDQEYKSGQNPLNAYGQRFASQQPQRVGLSPEAQAQAAAVKAKIAPSADEQVKAQTALTVQNIRSQDAQVRSGAILDAAKLRAQSQDRASQARIDAEVMRTNNQAAIAQYKVTSMQLMQQKRLEQTDQHFQKTMMLKEKALGVMAGNKSFMELSKTADELQKRIANTKTQKAALDKNIEALSAKGFWTKHFNQDELKDWQTQSFDLQQTLGNLDADSDALQKKMAIAVQVGMMQQGNSGGGDSGGSGNGGVDITVSSDDMSDDE